MSIEYIRIKDDMFKVHPLDEPILPEKIYFLSGKTLDINFNQNRPLIFKVKYNDGSFPGHVHDSGSIPVYSKLFIEMIKLSGIDNFQLFHAIIIDEDNDKQWDEFYAFNAIGLIDAVHPDSNSSIIMPGSDDEIPALVKYEKMVIDLTKTSGIGMFREINSSELLFHKKLYEILKKNIPKDGWKIKIRSYESK